jgi:hypothetical protein
MDAPVPVQPQDASDVRQTSFGMFLSIKLEPIADRLGFGPRQCR